MTYPGNPSLAAPVKDRVVSTFQQTLALFRQGRRDEVAAGCNLILQMDPMFDPAKKLLEKTRNPAAPIDVDSLLVADPRSMLDQARVATAARDFQRVIQLTSEILTDDLMNDEARVLGDEAREKLEAAPFIEQFVRKAEQNIASGRAEAAKADLEKARSLDPNHPEVLRLHQTISARQSGPRPAAPAQAPSFVVDSAPPSGRSTSQASDFGFTFEEEKPAEQSFANFSFDSPADTPFSFGAKTPAPGGEFDFSTASVATSPDDQKKIEQYLADGDRAFDAGDHQQAIDLWSRIFLIDVTNDQASERIERAKVKRREVEQKLDALISSAMTALDRRDYTRARAELQEVLRLDPNNTAAHEYLAKIPEPAAQGRPAPVAEPVPPSLDLDEKIDLDFFEDEVPEGIEAPLVPPPPSAAAAEPKKGGEAIPKAKKVSSPRKLPVGALLAVLGVLVVVAGGWFAWTRFFNKPEPEQTTGASEALIGRAKMLGERGRYDDAIRLLQDIRAGDPQHDAALVLIADLMQKKAGSGTTINGKPAGEYFHERILAAVAAFEQHDYAAAKTAFEEAQRVKPLPPEEKTKYDTAADQVAKLDAAKRLFTEQKYDEAIANLQPLLQQDPQNASVNRMIIDAHFNLGAKALQEERTADAVAQFDEVLKADPNDNLARRSRELALRYDKQTKDLLYRIYVKYLPLRQAT